jgi:hypothetical protein
MVMWSNGGILGSVADMCWGAGAREIAGAAAADDDDDEDEGEEALDPETLGTPVGEADDVVTVVDRAA